MGRAMKDNEFNFSQEALQWFYDVANDKIEIKKYWTKVDRKTGDLVLHIKTPWGMFGHRISKASIVDEIKQSLQHTYNTFSNP